MHKDIEKREDIDLLVEAFYAKLLTDKDLSLIFLEVAQINITDHLPIIGDFWESVLFQVGKYKGNTLGLHLDLHQKHRLKKKHFNQWLKLFNETVDEYFQGEVAQKAKDRALSIATIIKMKIDNLEEMRLALNN